MTIDQIAEAADVGRMTVFNHFPRKEDMFFDRDEEGHEILRAALRQRDPRVAPIEALRLLAHGWPRKSPLRRVLSGEPGLHRDDRAERNPQGAGQGDTRRESRSW